MKILINAINLTSAGTAATARALFDVIHEVIDGHELAVVVRQDGGLRPEHASPGVRWICYQPWTGPLYTCWRLWFDFRELPRLARMIGADAVFAMGNHLPGRYDVPATVLYRNPHYIEPDRDLSFAKRLEKQLFARTVARRPKFIAQSEEMRRRLTTSWDVPSASIEVVANGLSADFLAGSVARDGPASTDGIFRLLYVSRYYPHKNHEYLVELAGRWKDFGSGKILLQCTVDPDSAPGRRLASRARSLGVDDMIELLGELTSDELARRYREADALIFPSRMETFGNPLLEAMAHGLPVLAADRPYAHEICGDSALYFSLDRVDDARRKIEQLRLEQNRYADCSARGIERLSAFPSWREVAASYLSIIEQSAARP